jgi:hypothetical protein
MTKSDKEADTEVVSRLLIVRDYARMSNRRGVAWAPPEPLVFDEI